MKTKDSTVETEFHPMLTSFLFACDGTYRSWGGELIITSGSEPGTVHSKTSLHYAKPCQAADIRVWSYADIPTPRSQLAELLLIKNIFCDVNNIPPDWIDIILEGDHIHIEFQPKRIS